MHHFPCLNCHVYCSILKELLLDSPHWVAWAVTGSSMATLWANIAATPVSNWCCSPRTQRSGTYGFRALQSNPTLPVHPQTTQPSGGPCLPHHHNPSRDPHSASHASPSCVTHDCSVCRA